MKRLFATSFLLFTFIVALSAVANSDENEDKKARQSFEQLIKKMIDYGAKTISEPYEAAGGFRLKKWQKNDEVAYDIQKSNSIISPYTATLKLRAESCVTEPASSPEDIKRDFKCSDNPKTPWVQKYVFAYQDGIWELKNAGFNILFNPKGQYVNIEKTSDIKLNGDNTLNYIFNVSTIRQLQNPSIENASDKK